MNKLLIFPKLCSYLFNKINTKKLLTNHFICDIIYTEKRRKELHIMTDLEKFEIALREWNCIHTEPIEADEGEMIEAKYHACDEMGWVD